MTAARIFQDEDGVLRYQPAVQKQAVKPAVQAPTYQHIWVFIKGVKRWCGTVIELAPYQVDATIDMDTLKHYGVGPFRSEISFDEHGKVYAYELHPLDGV